MNYIYILTWIVNNLNLQDTEFPGVVARPIGEFRSNSEYQYQLHRCNVDLLKIIQLGLTFCDDVGNFPLTGAATFQFNFKFNLTWVEETFMNHYYLESVQCSNNYFNTHQHIT